MENHKQPVLIAGPCVIESAELLHTVARELVNINHTLGVDFIFKASFDKANRTSLHAFRGPGIDKGLEMLAEIKSTGEMMSHLRGMRIDSDVDFTATGIDMKANMALPKH